MGDSRPAVDPKLSFVAGWMLGRRGRNRSGMGCLFLVVGLMAALTSVLGLASAPLSWIDARAVQRLPQPSAAALRTMSPGTELLIPVRLRSAPTSESHGLDLFYTEVLSPGAVDDDDAAATDNATDDATVNGADAGDTGGGWLRVPAQEWRTDVRLDDELSLTVQLLPDAHLHNATTVADPAENARRYVGYLPGRALAVHGVWEGDGLLTAEAFYAGTIDEYLSYRSRQPGFALLGGLACAGAALIFLMIGSVLRFVGA